MYDLERFYGTKVGFYKGTDSYKSYKLVQTPNFSVRLMPYSWSFFSKFAETCWSFCLSCYVKLHCWNYTLQSRCFCHPWLDTLYKYGLLFVTPSKKWTSFSVNRSQKPPFAHHPIGNLSKFLEPGSCCNEFWFFKNSVIRKNIDSVTCLDW